MNYTQVSYGSQGDEVKKLQELLNSNGAQLDVDGVFGDKTQQAVKDYQSANNLEVDGIVGKNTWGALTKNVTTSTPTTDTPTTETPTETKAPTFEYGAYEKSDVVKQAEALLQQQLANKPGAYTSPWQTQLNEMLDKIMNREKFSYDLNGDMLYNQYKDQYTTQGKMGMMDTMGQAQAMTGGYGNSYAQQVGQQAYQGYLQQLNDRIPELYQLALDQYNREGDDMYNQASLMASMEEQDYGRWRDEMSDYNAELGRLTEDARYQGELDYGRWQDAHDRAYQMYLNDQQSASGYYDRLVTMITTLGYVPTEEELEKAGMSQAQYQAYKGYYDKQNPTPKNGTYRNTNPTDPGDPDPIVEDPVEPVTPTESDRAKNFVTSIGKYSVWKPRGLTEREYAAMVKSSLNTKNFTPEEFAYIEKQLGI